MCCKNCGNQLIEEITFCPKCGAKIEQITNSQNMNNIIQNQNNVMYSQNINSKITEEDLKRAYVGEKYDSFENGGAIIFPFLLGPIYLLYRKMYLLALLWMVIIFASSLIPVLSVLNAVNLILMIVKFKEIYMKYVENKINKIKLENPTAEKQQLINICSKKGGVDIVVPIIIGSAIFLMVLFACVIKPIILDLKEENENYKDEDYDFAEELGEGEILVNFTDVSETIANAYGNPGTIKKIIVKNFKLDNKTTSLVLTAIPSTYGFDVYVNEKNVGSVGYGNLTIFDNKYLGISGYYGTTCYPNGYYQKYIDSSGEIIINLDGYDMIEWNEDNNLLKYRKLSEANIKPNDLCMGIACKNYTSVELSNVAYEEYTIEYKNGLFSNPSNVMLIEISSVCE